MGVFNIFHDCVIVKHEYVSGILKLDIEIQYLATRIYIVGLSTPDDVLDAVFSKFCIGK